MSHIYKINEKVFFMLYMYEFLFNIVNSFKVMKVLLGLEWIILA